jgi:hypothetical protein
MLMVRIRHMGVGVLHHTVAVAMAVGTYGYFCMNVCVVVVIMSVSMLMLQGIMGMHVFVSLCKVKQDTTDHESPAHHHQP